VSGAEARSEAEVSSAPPVRIRDVGELRERRLRARRRRRLARIDVGIGVALALILLLAAPGLAIVALVALLALAATAGSLLLARWRGRASRR
jgi:hypothetical protein